ncbi:MAG: peroxiredoxin [Bacteroidota bacterium]
MAIKIGDLCSDFEAMNQHGESIRLSDYKNSKNVVLFFYPKDETAGCTKEVCSFRDSYEDFVSLGSEVIGISSDSHGSHQNFASKHNLNFHILSDPKGLIRKSFGVPSRFFGLIPGRVTYIIDKEGRVKDIFENLFEAELHIRNAMDVLRKME